MVEIKTYRQFLKEDGPKIKQIHKMPVSKWTKLSNGLWVTPFKRFGLEELDELCVCITDNPSENFLGEMNFLDEMIKKYSVENGKIVENESQRNV